MADVRVTCIIKQNPLSPHEHITHIGGVGWVWTREEVITSIRSRINTFYVIDSSNGRRADVGVIEPGYGRDPYLRTYADDVWNDNLLSLPQCRL